MTRFVRVGLTVGTLLIGFALVGCEDFDPSAVFDSELFNTKKKLPGERIPVFPEGTPGVPQGVPPELVKGYQAPPDPATASREASSKTASKEAPNKETSSKDASNKDASGKDAKETSKQAAAEPTELKPKPKPKPKPKVAAKPAEQTTASAAPAPQPAPQSQQWPDQSQTQQAPAAAAWPGSARPSGGVAWPDPPAPR
jgi:hypothetical protein